MNYDVDKLNELLNRPDSPDSLPNLRKLQDIVMEKLWIASQRSAYYRERQILWRHVEWINQKIVERKTQVPSRKGKA